MSNSTDVGRELNVITASFFLYMHKSEKACGQNAQYYEERRGWTEMIQSYCLENNESYKERNSCNEKLTWRMLQAIFCYGGISSPFPMYNLCYVRIRSFLVPIPFNWIITRNAFTTYQGPIKLTLSALDKCCFSWPPLHYISSHCKSFLQFLGYSLRPGNWIKRRYAR